MQKIPEKHYFINYKYYDEIPNHCQLSALEILLLYSALDLMIILYRE